MKDPGVDYPDNDPGIQEVTSQCQTCARRNPNMVTCQAFPDGIPLAIILGAYDHTNPYIIEGDVADKGLRYLPRN